jgi:hypothetical protein
MFVTSSVSLAMTARKNVIVLAGSVVPPMNRRPKGNPDINKWWRLRLTPVAVSRHTICTLECDAGLHGDNDATRVKMFGARSCCLELFNGAGLVIVAI